MIYVINIYRVLIYNNTIITIFNKGIIDDCLKNNKIKTVVKIDRSTRFHGFYNNSLNEKNLQCYRYCFFFKFLMIKCKFHHDFL